MLAAENANHSGECAAQQSSFGILATKLRKSVAGLALPAAVLITACCFLLCSSHFLHAKKCCISAVD